MAKIPEAEARLFKRVFVCKHCKSKIKADQLKVLDKKIQCRKCGSRDLRVLKKK
jgi:ribosomal protein L40E